jgi:hypothetical protein
MDNLIEGFGTLSDPLLIAVCSKPPARLARTPVATALTNENYCRRDAITRPALIRIYLLASRRLESSAL